MEPTTGHIETALHHKLIAASGLSGLVAVRAVPEYWIATPSSSPWTTQYNPSAAACTFFAARFDTRKNVALVASLPPASRMSALPDTSKAR